MFLNQTLTLTYEVSSRVIMYRQRAGITNKPLQGNTSHFLGFILAITTDCLRIIHYISQKYNTIKKFFFQFLLIVLYGTISFKSVLHDSEYSSIYILYVSISIFFVPYVLKLASDLHNFK